MTCHAKKTKLKYTSRFFVLSEISLFTMTSHAKEENTKVQIVNFIFQIFVYLDLTNLINFLT